MLFVTLCRVWRLVPSTDVLLLWFQSCFVLKTEIVTKSLQVSQKFQGQQQRKVRLQLKQTIHWFVFQKKKSLQIPEKKLHGGVVQLQLEQHKVRQISSALWWQTCRSRRDGVFAHSPINLRHPGMQTICLAQPDVKRTVSLNIFFFLLFLC